MSLIRWNSGQDLLNFEREFRKLFDVMRPFGSSSREDDDYNSSVWAPLTDIVEEKDHFIVSADLPGMEKEDIKIQISNGRLSISGERKFEKEKKDRDYHRIERAYGKFYRSFDLPETINAEGIKADFKNGQLSILIPKAEEVKPREIPVQVN